MLSILLAPTAAAVTPVIDLGQYGRYTNVVPAGAPTAAYVEVCFVGGQELVDLHPAGGPTTGGNCAPGNFGFVLETAERPARRWAAALGTCVAAGMRLPTVFEVLYAEEYGVVMGLADPADLQTWVGSETQVQEPGTAAASIYALRADLSANWSWLDLQAATAPTSPFLCAQ